MKDNFFMLTSLSRWNLYPVAGDGYVLFGHRSDPRDAYETSQLDDDKVRKIQLVGVSGS